MQRALSMFLIAACAMAIISGCTDDVDERGKSFATILTVTNTTGTPITSIPLGTTVRFTIKVTNIGSEPATITRPSAATHQFRVTSKATNRVEWIDPPASAAVITTLTLAPGESRTYVKDWDQKRSDPPHERVLAGEYLIEAYIPSTPDLDKLHAYPFTLMIAPVASG